MRLTEPGRRLALDPWIWVPALTTEVVGNQQYRFVNQIPGRVLAAESFSATVGVQLTEREIVGPSLPVDPELFPDSEFLMTLDAPSFDRDAKTSLTVRPSAPAHQDYATWWLHPKSSGRQTLIVTVAHNGRNVGVFESRTKVVQIFGLTQRAVLTIGFAITLVSVLIAVATLVDRLTTK